MPTDISDGLLLAHQTHSLASCKAKGTAEFRRALHSLLLLSHPSHGYFCTVGVQVKLVAFSF